MSATTGWGPADTGACTGPARAVRHDRPPHPRLRRLADVLAERGTAPAPDPAPPAVTVDPDARRALGAARATAVRVAGVVAEVAAGRRPAGHLAPLADAATLDALTAGLRTVADRSTRLGAVRTGVESTTAVEACATLHAPSRSRALVLRLERGADATAWRVRLLVLL